MTDMNLENKVKENIFQNLKFCASFVTKGSVIFVDGVADQVFTHGRLLFVSRNQSFEDVFTLYKFWYGYFQDYLIPLEPNTAFTILSPICFQITKHNIHVGMIKVRELLQDQEKYLQQTMMQDGIFCFDYLDVRSLKDSPKINISEQDIIKWKLMNF